MRNQQSNRKIASFCTSDENHAIFLHKICNPKTGVCASTNTNRLLERMFFAGPTEIFHIPVTILGAIRDAKDICAVEQILGLPPLSTTSASARLRRILYHAINKVFRKASAKKPKPFVGAVVIDAARAATEEDFVGSPRHIGMAAPPRDPFARYTTPWKKTRHKKWHLRQADGRPEKMWAAPSVCRDHRMPFPLQQFAPQEETAWVIPHERWP